MRAAIVYYSLTGNVNFAAEQILHVLSKDYDVELISLIPKKTYPSQGIKKYIWGGKSALMGEQPELEPYTFHANSYDLIVVGTPIWASTICPPVRTFLVEQAKYMKDKKIGLYVCNSGGRTEKTFTVMKNLIGIQHARAELVLIDPKVKPSDSNNKKITEFCSYM